MTIAERTAAARQRREELVEILSGAVFDLYMRDKIHARYRSRGRAARPDDASRVEMLTTNTSRYSTPDPS